MSRMAISFLLSVKLSKAASIAAVSVFESTTRKFFWASGGVVTCYMALELAGVQAFECMIRQIEESRHTPTPASSRPVTESSSPMTARNCLSL